jgi:hypothetical protein
MTIATATQYAYSQPARDLRELTHTEAQPDDVNPLSRHLTRLPDDGTAPTDETQIERELNLAFTDLGGATFALAHQGALDDKRLAPRVRRILELFAQLDALALAAPVA